MDTSQKPDTVDRDGNTENTLDNGARAGELDSGSPECRPHPGPELAPAASVWDLFDEIWSRVPDEELRQLPSDGAEQHDHYLYGLPKKKR